MKVIHIISGADVGGARTHILNLLTNLSLLIDVKLVVLSKTDFLETARACGIDTILLEQKTRMDLSVIKDLKNLIKDFKADILHSHGARANFISALTKEDVIKISTMHSDYLHDFDNNLIKKIVFTSLNYYSLKKLKYYFVVSEDFKDMLIERGFNKNNILVIFNGISLDYKKADISKEEFLARYGLAYNEDYTYIGIAARLHPVKGIDTLLRGYAKLLEGGDNVKLLIAGGGESKYLRLYKNLAKDINIDKNLKFLGHVEDINNFYNVIDINVLSSHTEGFPYAILEGGLRKIATVSSAVGGIPEIIDNGVDGLLFEDSDYNDLASCLSKLVNNKIKRKEIGIKFELKIREKYSDKEMAKRHEYLYSKILKRDKNER